jgi:predicted nuclease of predicted toxin-antitoxin system
MRFVLEYFDRAPIDVEEILEAYAVLDAQSEAVWRSMGKNDLCIAATAYVTGRRLLTMDSDFDHLTPAFLTPAFLTAAFLSRDRIAGEAWRFGAADGSHWSPRSGSTPLLELQVAEAVAPKVPL